MPARSGSVDRREFLQHSLTAVGLGATGSWAMLREAVARARESQKPVLTETALNSYVQAVRARGTTSIQAFVTAVRSDVKGFVRSNFTLTTSQDRGLTAFSSTEVATIVDAVTRGVASRNDLRLKLGPAITTDPTAAASCRIFAKREAKALQDGVTSDVWTLLAARECAPYMC